MTEEIKVSSPWNFVSSDILRLLAETLLAKNVNQIQEVWFKSVIPIRHIFTPLDMDFLIDKKEYDKKALKGEYNAEFHKNFSQLHSLTFDSSILLVSLHRYFLPGFRLKHLIIKDSPSAFMDYVGYFDRLLHLEKLEINFESEQHKYGINGKNFKHPKFYHRLVHGLGYTVKLKSLRLIGLLFSQSHHVVQSAGSLRLRPIPDIFFVILLLPNLEHLSLDDTFFHIKDVHVLFRSLDCLKNLKYLSLATYCRESVYDAMDFSDDGDMLPTGDFPSLPNLETLILHRCCLFAFTDREFGNGAWFFHEKLYLPSLTHLDLGSNLSKSLNGFKANSFLNDNINAPIHNKQFPSLTSLDLSDLCLTEITYPVNYFIWTLPKLKKLNLNNNRNLRMASLFDLITGQSISEDEEVRHRSLEEVKILIIGCERCYAEKKEKSAWPCFRNVIWELPHWVPPKSLTDLSKKLDETSL